MQFDSLTHVHGHAETAPFKHGDTVTWFLRDHPGYLKKPAVEDAITEAFAGEESLDLKQRIDTKDFAQTPHTVG